MNESDKLDALTDQSVTLRLGDKTYRARRATLYDVGVMNKTRNEMMTQGNTGNLDMDVTMALLHSLLLDLPVDIKTPDDLAKSIPFASFEDVTKALELVGFKLPQTQKQEITETGA